MQLLENYIFPSTHINYLDFFKLANSRHSIPFELQRMTKFQSELLSNYWTGKVYLGCTNTRTIGILKAYLVVKLGIRMRIYASRQCAHYARASYAGAAEACVARVTFAVGLGSCLVWCQLYPKAAMALSRCHPRPPSPSPKNAVVHPSESSRSECVRLCDAHMAYM